MKVIDGFDKTYDDENVTLITLFSAGGANNGDLPETSSYRKVTPKAMTLAIAADGESTIEPWNIDYETFNDPAHNAFFKAPPEIELRQ